MHQPQAGTAGYGMIPTKKTFSRHHRIKELATKTQRHKKEFFINIPFVSLCLSGKKYYGEKK
jgi:hypothetical protein